MGQLWCCGREFQNSIDESVHRLMLDEAVRLGFEGFTSDNNHIYHASGGRNFYRGLGRNIGSLKSMLSGVDGLWIEEGDSLSAETLRVLSASLRLSAADAERVIAGEDVKMPEIWITLNRGNSTDPISQKWLKRAEKDLARCGYYEDDNIMIVEINYTDMPKKWFEASGLESERADDEENLSPAAYEHKWLGAYADTVENAIIMPHWFDACVDAHKVLGFEPRGIEIVTHDPSDDGSDAKGLTYRHGVVILDAQERNIGDINEGGDWAIEYCEERKPDMFLWDGDGMGVGLRRQFKDALMPKRIKVEMFKGSNSVDRPDDLYEAAGDVGVKTNKQTFKNKRAQYYWLLRDRIYRTYQAVEKKKYFDPDELISFDSGIESLDLLRSEVCRIPLKRTPTGLIQIMSKQDMARLGIESPNMADALMMSFANPILLVNARPKARAVRAKAASGWS